MHRVDKIHFLIEDDIDHIENSGDGKHILRSILHIGHQGYVNMTDDELEAEYTNRFEKPD